uniref:Uncharacterized protein n=1 Tax=Nelumbo nucifera TaxID=4432 RepID=A0A822Y192_NELNU|nr:TPA_asm: hypothetical protein HUJ06_027848 [Nelumbo nucifera]
MTKLLVLNLRNGYTFWLSISSPYKKRKEAQKKVEEMKNEWGNKQGIY